MRTRNDSRLAALALVLISVAGLGMLFSPHFGRPDDAVEPPPRQLPKAALDADFVAGVESLRAGRHHEALLALQRFIERFPAVPEAHVNSGFAYFALGQNAAAEVAFNRAIELRPEQANAYYGLALVHEARGDLDLARGAMKTFVHLAPESDPHARRAQAALWEWAEGAGAGAGG